MDKTIRLDEINPWRVAQDLLRNIWVAVLLAAAVWLGISAYEKLEYEPVYTSKATIVVSARGNSGAYNALSLTTNMAQVFAEVFESNVLRERVEEQMGKSVGGTISTRTIPNTNLLVLSLSSDNPEQAFRTLKILIETYPQVAEDMFSNAVLTVIKEPDIPRAPSNSMSMTQTKRLMTAMVFVCAMAILAVLSILRPTAQTAAAAKRRVDGRLLRSIRHEVRNKTFRSLKRKKNIAPLITSHLTSPGFKEDNQSLCSKMEYHMRKRDQKVILVSSAGENEGKSTVAANLALGLSQRDKKVILLDCDFRKPAVYKIFEIKIDKEKDFGHYLTHENNSPDFIVSKQGLDMGVNITGLKNPQRVISSGRMRRSLESLREQYDYIVLDSPPMMVAADTEALSKLADVAVLVAREDFVAVRDINDCLDVLRRSCPDVAGFVMNNCLDTHRLA